MRRCARSLQRVESRFSARWLTESRLSKHAVPEGMHTAGLLWLEKQRVPLSQVELSESRRVDWDVVVKVEVAISRSKGDAGTFSV